MIIDTIKADILSATKSRNTTASEILKVVLGECPSKDNFTDDFVIRYCRKLVEANTETMKFGDYAKLSRQNELLRSYLPKEVSKDIGGIMYYNCGDWVESNTAIVEYTTGEFVIVSMKALDQYDQ